MTLVRSHRRKSGFVKSYLRTRKVKKLNRRATKKALYGGYKFTSANRDMRTGTPASRKKMFFLKDANGRVAPKFGFTPRYTHRRATEMEDHVAQQRRLAAIAEARRAAHGIVIHAPDRVSISFSQPPNRKPGSLKVGRSHGRVTLRH